LGSIQLRTIVCRLSEERGRERPGKASVGPRNGGDNAHELRFIVRVAKSEDDSVCGESEYSPASAAATAWMASGSAESRSTALTLADPSKRARD
jgi:hypothetical protein